MDASLALFACMYIFIATSKGLFTVFLCEAPRKTPPREMPLLLLLLESDEREVVLINGGREGAREREREKKELETVQTDQVFR